MPYGAQRDADTEAFRVTQECRDAILRDRQRFDYYLPDGYEYASTYMTLMPATPAGDSTRRLPAILRHYSSLVVDTRATLPSILAPCACSQF